jgi:hypothetical protein
MAALVALSLMANDGAAVAQSAAPLSIAAAVQRAGPAHVHASHLGRSTLLFPGLAILALFGGIFILSLHPSSP